MYNTEHWPIKIALRLVTSTETAFLLQRWYQERKKTAFLASAFPIFLPLLPLLKDFSSKATKTVDGEGNVDQSKL